MKKFVAILSLLGVVALCTAGVVSAAGAEKKELVAAVVVKAIGSVWFDSMGWETDKWAEKVKNSDRGFVIE
ncbi:MAG: hypothetical protein LBS00_05215, partial [Synergistaceae bacterium]|nr:hypothetical protein [Synergistaceae bacterium]